MKKLLVSVVAAFCILIGGTAFADFTICGWMNVDQMTVYASEVSIDQDCCSPIPTSVLWIDFSHEYYGGVQSYYLPATARGRSLIGALWLAHVVHKPIGVCLEYTLQPLSVRITSISSPGDPR